MASSTTAPESAGAVSDLGASSAGVAPDSGATLTDDQILNITEDTSPSTETSVPEMVQPTTEAAPAAADTGIITHDEIKQFFQNQQVGPKIQRFYDTYTSLTNKFGTLADAKKAADFVQDIGGIAKFESLVNKSIDVDNTDAVFERGSLEERQALADGWIKDFGAATPEMMEITLDRMKQLAPESYNGFAKNVVSDVMKGQNFDSFIDTLSEALTGADGERVTRLATELVNWAKNSGLTRQSTPDPKAFQKFESEKQSISKQREELQTQAREEATQVADNLLAQEITKQFDAFRTADGKRIGVSAYLRTKIENDIRQKVFEQAASNSVLKSQIASIQARGGPARQMYQEMAKRLGEAYLRILPESIKSVMGEWTGSLVSASKEAAAKAKNTAERPDIASGTTTGQSARAIPSVDKLKKDGTYKKMTDDDILSL